MKNIKEAEELTGISRQNIRYYEKMGLLNPKRDAGNGYRKYDEEDIGRLKLCGQTGRTSLHETG